jgi:hypothetical protein
VGYTLILLFTILRIETRVPPSIPDVQSGQSVACERRKKTDYRYRWMPEVSTASPDKFTLRVRMFYSPTFIVVADIFSQPPCRINKSYVTKINSSYMMTAPSSRVYSLLWLEATVVAFMSNTMCHPLRRCQPRDYSTLLQGLLNEDVVIERQSIVKNLEIVTC